MRWMYVAACFAASAAACFDKQPLPGLAIGALGCLLTLWAHDGVRRWYRSSEPYRSMYPPPSDDVETLDELPGEASHTRNIGPFRSKDSKRKAS